MGTPTLRADDAPRVRYDVPTSCPSQDDFVARLRARLSTDAARFPSVASVSVEIRERAGAVHGSVQIEQAATRTQRSLEGASCAEVVDGLALIAALALAEPPASAAPLPARRRRAESGASRVRGATAATRSGASRGTTPDSTARSKVADAATDRSETRETAGDRAQRQADFPTADRNATAQSAADRAQRQADLPSADRDSTALSAADRDATAQSAASHRASAADSGRGKDAGADRREVRIGTSVLALYGVAPTIQPGVQLQATFALAAVLQLRVGARLAWRDTLRSSLGDAHFDFAAGIVQLCATSEVGTGRFVLRGCFIAEPGIHRAAAERTLNPRTYTRPWLAAGAGVELAVRAASWLHVHAGAELLAPIRRDRMLIANEALYQVPLFGLRLQLGLEVPLG